MSLVLSVALSCQGLYGLAQLTAIAGGSGTYGYALRREYDKVTVFSGTVTDADLAAGSRDFASLYDGAYTLLATDANDPDTTGEQFFEVTCGTVLPGSGGALPLKLDSLTHADATGAGGTGSVTLTVSGGTGQLYASVGLGALQAITAGVPITIAGLAAPATYLVDVHDSLTPTNAYVRDTVTIKLLIGGCTDPLATNPTAGATFDDGSCQYAPPPPVPPAFRVPKLQTLRFVTRGQGPQGVDGTLLCEQPRAGQPVRPYFFQLVQRTDPVRVQVLSSFAAVTAIIRQHTSQQVVGQPVSLQQVLTLEGTAPALAVVLSEDTATGLTRVAPAQGTLLPVSLQMAPRLTLGGAAQGTYRVTQFVPGSVLSAADYALLNRPWVVPGAGAVTARWPVTGPGFNVWEADLPIAALPDGTYQVQLRGTRAGVADVVADSEPFSVRDSWPDTLAVDFTNVDNAFATIFSTGLTPRLRVKGTLFRQKNGGDLTSYTDSTAASTTLASTATRLVPLEVYGAPAWLHEKLFLACRLDSLLVEGLRYVSPAAYAYELPRAYPLGGGSVDLQQADWLGAGNGDDAGLAATVPNALQLTTGQYVTLRGK